MKSVRDDVRARLHRLEVGLFACGASCEEQASVVLGEAEEIFERVGDVICSDLRGTRMISANFFERMLEEVRVAVGADGSHVDFGRRVRTFFDHIECTIWLDLCDEIEERKTP